MEYTQQLLEEIGLEGRRIQMINLSSAMGGQFAWSAAELTADIKRIGPNPLGKNGHLAVDNGDQEAAKEATGDQELAREVAG